MYSENELVTNGSKGLVNEGVYSLWCVGASIVARAHTIFVGFISLNASKEDAVKSIYFHTLTPKKQIKIMKIRHSSEDMK